MGKYSRLIAPIVALAVLACSLSAPPGSWANPSTETGEPISHTPTIEAPAAEDAASSRLLLVSPTPPPTAIPTQAAICKVKTGLDNGRLNLRSCAGVGCRAIAWLEEGQSLTILSTPPAGSWLPVRTGELQGWVNSAFCEANP